LAKTPRTWTGARTPSGLKRVRQSNRRHEVLGPRRSAAKTYVAKALSTATADDAEATTAALIEALSALDRAAKAGAIHPNAAARRKSRLTRRVNEAVGGAGEASGSRVVKQTGRAAAAKAAKARIAAGKSAKAKGAQTAAGKARAALSKTARAEAAAAQAAEAGAAEAAPKATRPAPKPAAKTASTKAPAKAKATTAKASAPKTTTAKSTSKTAAKAPAKRTTKS
jgi:ribosomal protein S20